MDFHSLRSLVVEYQEGYTKLTVEQIKERIQESYEDDTIDGSQYDHLMGLLD